MMHRRKIHRLDISTAEQYSLETSSGSISYLLLRSSRRETIEVRITTHGQVRVTAPSYVCQDDIEKFLSQRAHWVTERLNEISGMKAFVECRRYDTGQEFLFLGKNFPIYVEQDPGCLRAKISFDAHGWVITVPHNVSDDQKQEKVKDVLVKWYQQQAREVFGSRVFHFVRLMGLEPMTIEVKSQRAVWGLCRYHEKSIAFNWLLVLAPVHVIDYVIVHELAHLTHPNHSKRFWGMVEQFLPDYQERQDWLKHHQLQMTLP